MGDLILINADGDPDTRAERNRALVRAGFQALQAEDAASVLDCITRHRYSASLILIRTPPAQTDLTSLCRELRAAAHTPCFIVRLLGADEPLPDPAERDAPDTWLGDCYDRPDWLSTIRGYAVLLRRHAASTRQIAALESQLGRQEKGIGKPRLAELPEAEPDQAISGMGAWSVDFETSQESREPEVERILGEPATAAEGASIRYLTGETRARIQRAFLQLAAADGSFDEEFRVFMPDGTVRWLRDRGRVLKDVDGQPRYAAGALADITERKAYEATIQDLNRQLQRKVDELEALLEFAPVAIAVAEDAKGRRIRLNPGFKRLLGLESERDPMPLLENGLAPYNCRFRCNGEECAARDLPLFRVLRSGQALMHFQLDIELPDGRVISQLGHAVPLFDERGRVRGATAIGLDITEFKRAQAEKIRLFEIMEATSDLVATADPAGRVNYINRAGRKLLGLPEDVDIAGTSVADYHPEWAYRIVADVGIPAALTRGDWSGDNAVLHRDGHEVAISQVIITHKSPAGEVQFLSTIARDITERKRAEDALRFERSLLDALQTAAPVGLAFVDRQFRFLRVNDALAKIHGTSADTLVGRTVADTVPELWPALAPIYRRVLESGEVVANVEVSMQNRNSRGARGYWMANYYPLRVAGEVVAAGVVLQDITENKHAADALGESERQLESALMGAELGIWDLDLNAGIVTVDDRWAKLLKAKPKRSCIKLSQLSRQLPNDEKERALEAYRAHLEGKAAFYEGEYQWKSRTGLKRWLQVRGKVLERTADGKAVRAVGIYRDISDRKELEDRCGELRENLLHAQRLTTVGELAAMVAHELNQPLGAITNYLGGVRLRFPEILENNPQLDEVLQETRRLSLRAAEVVKGVRDLVRKPGQRREWLSVTSLISDCILLARAELRRRNIKLILSVLAELPQIWGQRVHLQQLVLNLALNAMEAMEGNPADQRELRISAESTGGDGVEIQVGDNGIGFPDGMADRLAEPFVSTKPQGIGLGLSICKTIVEAHGGSISATPAPERGAVLKVWLPVQCEPGAP